MRNLWLAMLAVAALAAPAPAQETTGTITGVTTDQSGGVLPGVTVIVKNTGTAGVRTVVTNEAGIYTASLLPIGVYQITFELSGFQPLSVKDIALHVNDRLQIDGHMSVGGVAESVVVTGGHELVQPIPQLQTTMDSRNVQELPLNNRNFVQLATLAPGVSSDLSDEVGIGLTSTVSISVNGARRNAVNWLVDGVSNVDVGSNITLLSTPTLESIEEFKIITNSYAAEWPRSGGGIVNVVTKSGSNRFSGSAYEFLRHDELNANSFFRNLSSNADSNSRPPKLRYHNFGGTVGGPAIPSKMFFFYSEEARRVTREPASRTAQVYDPAWLTDPASSNYVAPAQRDANAVRLLALWPAPNVAGTTRFVNSQANINNTRQEVVRADYELTPSWRLTGRYTHDNSYTEEPGGLFLNLLVPNVGTTQTNVPGQVAAAQLRGVIGSQSVNELQFQFSSNTITDTNPDGANNTRTSLGLSVPELFSGNAGNYMPGITISGMSPISATQLYTIEYRNYSITDSFTTQRGRHSIKTGGLATFESKNENGANNTQGSFNFVATAGGRTAFQNFLTGNADGLCGSGCTYSEAELDVSERLRFNRFELYAQDTWKPRSNVTVDIGLRYSLYPPITDANNVLTNFSPSAYVASAAPAFANANGSLITIGTGNPLNGIVVAGRNSPYGNAIYAFEKTDFQPRAGVVWDPGKDGRMIVRGSYGMYYDQALVGIFEQNSFTNPPFVSTISLQNPRLSNPTAGTSPTTTGVRALIGNGDNFRVPRTQQWSVGLERRLYSKGVVDVSYVGTHGDRLIRPIDINYPQPADVVRLNGATNLARPYAGYGAITIRETSARSNYWGMLTSFRHQAGSAGALTLNYTLSRNRTDSTSDRDAVDIPQNPRDLAGEYADARTDRRHIFTANYVYMLPFFKTTTSPALRTIAAGWQLSGITTMNSGQPVSRISADTNSFRRGNRPNLVGDPRAGEQTANLYWFDPAAYAPAADGTFGNSQRGEWRQPGRNQTDLSLSKNWSFNRTQRVQFRADFINAFNHTQWAADPNVVGLDNTCTVSTTTCNPPNDTFGQILNSRAPREIQLGLKFYW